MAEHFDLIIIGGGAAGLAAAATLAGQPVRALLLEQADRPGKKLLATGNGRCNLYQTGLTPQSFHSTTPGQLPAFLATLVQANQPDFWHGLGLLTQEEEAGRVYPLCRQATAVVRLLCTVAQEGGVPILCNQSVTAVRRNAGGFAITTAQGGRYTAERVILATGGMAAPKLCATGEGYPLARQLGHSCTPLRPGLVPIRCVNPSKTLKGMRTPCTVALCRGQEVVCTRGGEVQFTEYGVSGIVMMDLSNHMEPGEAYTLRLDLLPDLSATELEAVLLQKQARYPAQKAELLLLGVVRQQLHELLLRACRIDGKRRTLASLNREEIATLVQRIKGWSIRTEGTLGWDHAQITCGGIPLTELDPDTFASRLVPGLFLAGELADAAGYCGGYNLSWAFGSGILAARSALAPSVTP